VVGHATLAKATRESEKPPEPEGPSDFSTVKLALGVLPVKSDAPRESKASRNSLQLPRSGTRLSLARGYQDSVRCRRLRRLRAPGTLRSEALGWRITFESDEEYVIRPPEGGREVDVAPDILFVKVPDRKVVKNRLHFDLRPENQEAEVQRILALGATRADIGQRDVSWVVLADRKGNESAFLRHFPLQPKHA
jgi:hypothetical protein